MLPWYSPWLKVSLALRMALTYPWDASAWAEVRQHIPWLLAELRNLSTRMRHGVREFTVAGSAQTSRRTGSVNVKVEPCPAWLFTQIRPPWSSMNFRESASPRPVPSTF